MRPFRIDVGIDHIKNHLLSKIDRTDPVEVEKVGRYLKHIEMYRRIDRTVKKEGLSVLVRNGKQEFIRPHPLLADMNKVNTSIMSIEKTFNFIDEKEGNKKFSSEDLI